MRDFYTLYSAAACPSASAKQQAVSALASKFLASCPANSVSAYTGVLIVIRKMVTKLAMVFATLLSMATRLVATMAQGPYADFARFKSEMYSDWTWLKREASSTMGVVADMLVDLMLNSGSVGRAFMQMSYLICDHYSDFFVWYMNMWCKYVQTYMAKFLGAMRKGLGMTRGGFEMLNDFMDLVLQGVMPAAFVAKYGGDFQNLLTSAYSEPTKNKKGRGGNVRPSQEIRPISKTSGFKSGLTKSMKYISAVPGNTWMQMAALGVGAYFAINEAQTDSILSKLYPANWSLFDFTGVIDVIDNMETYLRSEEASQRCVRWEAVRLIKPDFSPISCARLSLKDANYTQASTVTVDASQCWASAVPSAGQSSLFACTAASTCCADLSCTPCDPTEAVCTTMVPCYSCPLGQQGTAQYACDTALQKCR